MSKQPFVLLASTFIIVLGACQNQSTVPTRSTSDPKSADPATSAAIPNGDTAGPTFESITTSTKFIAKSDCRPTSITITARITDPSGIASAFLWYRVGEDQPFTQVSMQQDDNGDYSATVRALDTPGGEYGVWEFYLTSEDAAGNTSQSPIDTSVQLLACLG